MTSSTTAQALSKRGCVSDCVVPSCATLRCKSSETCILSSQTCESCPSVSCISLALTEPNVATSTASFPRGAIAGIVIAAVILMAGLIYLLIRIRKRRALIQEITRKQSCAFEKGVLEDVSDEETPCTRETSLVDAASITIGLGSSILDGIGTAEDRSPHLSSIGDHFFSADELLRMSYAETSRANSILSLATSNIPSNPSMDTEAAIMQANNPITAVRARAAVVQLPRNVTTTHQRSSGIIPVSKGQASGQFQELNKSFWEEDTESIVSSPIERDFISAADMGTVESSLKTHTSVVHSPTTPSLARSRVLTQEHDST